MTARKCKKCKADMSLKNAKLYNNTCYTCFMKKSYQGGRIFSKEREKENKKFYAKHFVDAFAYKLIER